MHNPNTQTYFVITDRLSCISTNLIYLCSCKKCNKLYEGEIQNSLRDILNGHLSDIRRKTDKSLYRHFNQLNNYMEDLIITPIEKVCNTDVNGKRVSLTRESFWISQLNRITNHGLNIQSDAKNIQFVLRYNSAACKASIIGKAYYSKLQDLYPNVLSKNLIIAYSRNTNLSGILAPSKIRETED